MTVLNIANDGYFNVLIVLYRAIAVYGPMEKDRLLTLCSAGPNSDPNRLRQTLNRWTQFGLFVEEKNKIDLVSDIKKKGAGNRKSGRHDDSLLTSQVRHILFRDKNNERFWDKEKTLCADLTRGLAFLLAQDIYTTDLGSHAKVQKIEQLQVPDEDRRILQNDVRWNGLRSWGNYLGFIWQGNALIIDPTRALREDLRLVFGSAETLSATDFILRIADVLPVLDGGRYRVEVESALDTVHWKKPSREDLLSTSLSRALWRLNQSGHLLFETRADAGDGRSLQRSDGQDWIRFTHVRISGGNK